MADNDLPPIEISLEDLTQLGHSSHRVYQQGSGDTYDESRSNAMTNNVYGINHRQTPLAVPLNRDRYGYTFFTRPQLNMQGANLRSVRRFYPLLTTTPNSYQRMVRCLLDPRLMRGYKASATNSSELDLETQALGCDLVDPDMAFLPILTNSLNSISGWPDLQVQTFTSKPGNYHEAWSIADDTTVNYTSFDVTANFRNSRGSPIPSLFSYWEHYKGYVFDGTMVPYPDMIVENEIDYMTRIYRLIMDPTNRIVTYICASGASFPIGLSTGSMYDFDSTKPYNDVNAELTVPLRCMGFIDNDDILIRSFNWTVEVFNPSMRKRARESGESTMIPRYLLQLFNNRGYPRIDPKTRELQWWIDTQYYNAKLLAFRNLDQAIDNVMGLNLLNA